LLLYFHYSYSLFIKFFNQIHQLVFISINLHLISSGYYVAHVRQRQNISILMIVIKKVMGVSISFILISYCWRNSLKANQFCHIFAKIYSKIYLCTHKTSGQTKIHWTLGLWWDIFYEIGHFHLILKLVKMQKVWNITTIFYWNYQQNT